MNLMCKFGVTILSIFIFFNCAYSIQLNGTYTINANLNADSSNFKDISSAITYLTSSGTRSDGGPSNSTPFGVSGSVIFQVAAGTYTISSAISIPTITGVSSSSKVTFDGGNASTCLIIGNIDSNAIFKLSLCNYVILRNLTVTNTSTNVCTGVTIMGNATSNSGLGCSIKNCKINLPNAIFPKPSHCIFLSPVANGSMINSAATTGVDSIDIDSNLLNGGSLGFYLFGVSSTAFNKGIKIRNNIINAYTGGIYCSQIYNAVEIRNNTINLLNNGSPTSTGINMLGCLNSSSFAHQVIGNKISNAKAIGISLYQSGSSGSSPTKIHNNMICAGFSYSQYNYGIYLFLTNTSYNTEIFHNTVYMDFAAGTVYGLYHNSTGGVVVKNNIFVTDINSTLSVVYPAYFSNNPSGNVINYNTYYNTANNNIIYRGGAFTTSSFLSATAGGDSSFNLFPLFRSKLDLHLASACTPKGFNLTSVTTDIDGETRSVTPDIGCDELSLDSNDISVSKLINPVFPIISGAQNLTVKITNNGLNAVTAFNVSYKLNNGSVITKPWTGTLNLCDTISVTFSGTQQINLNNGINSIKIYSSLPNGVSDRNLLNDTLIKELSTPLNGTYIIGSSPSDFTNIASAVNALSSRGISGHTMFNIKSGVYNESVTLTNVPGSSITQTVIFKSLVNNPDSVIIGSTSNFSSSLKIINSSYVKFKSLLFSVPGNVSGSSLVSIEGTSSFDTIEYCKLQRTANPNSNIASIIVQVPAEGLVFRHNSISGGGVYLQGVSTVAPMNNTVFENNSILNDWQPIHITYQNGMIFRNNKIHLNVTGLSNNASVWFNDLSNTLIANNTITNDSFTVSTPQISFLFSFNITSANMNNVRIYNNSIHTACSGGYLNIYNIAGYVSNDDIKNNVFSHIHYSPDTSPPTYRFQFSQLPTPSVVTLDYNNYYTTSNPLIKIISSTNFNDVTSWKLASHTDTNSLSYRPGFTSNLDLTPNPFDSASWSLNGRGTHLTVVPRDINDSIRPPNKQVGVPDIGAYEFTPLVEPPYAKATPAVPSAGTMQHFTFGEDTVARIKWDAFYPVPSSLNMKNFSGDKPLGTFNGASYMRSYWRIDSVATATYNYDLLLRYKDPWLGTNANETNLLQARNNTASSNTWNVYSTSTIVDTFMNYMSVAGINDFKRFHTGTNTSNTLPVNLFNISASKIKNDAIVNWTTAQEINTNVFEVERLLNSEHAKEWLMLGKLKAAGNSNSIKNYRFTDPDVILSLSKDASFLSTTKTIYYRLKIIDNDGSCTYSKIVSIKLDDELTKNVVQVFPNPFNDFFLVKVILNEDSEIKFRLIDISGKTLFSQNEYLTKGTAILDLKNLPQLQSGFYFLSFVVDWKFHSIKLIRE